MIMDVTNAEQAMIAEKAGAVAVMALERVPSDIRKEGGVARMASSEEDPRDHGRVTIPVMAKARIGHFTEAQMLEALGVDFIDESEVLTPADEEHHIDKHDFKVPFVCGARNLGEALRRIGEGAAMIRTKGEAGRATSSKRCGIFGESRRDEAAHGARQGRAGARSQESRRAFRTGASGCAARAACRCRTSRRAGSRRRPMRRW